ncbi:MAG: hypothetical protein COV72_07095 [Candidatus Omnitrophica bacterium CG11_big_fil_rev_8_21_14_0_20_42_13]|uniref:Prepilin-type cleavage/methylation domain-containing protein n=1 Tax=Candidatus Ghiorseimicrobium undicola TaxID=1974746 RepID=A0A2H0LWE5_9BACT|nr:MAG: hypothetical protein COV72_07095 [Candidatus Omnitrophica bacterium CG11_big_fil_rev_8_21_14_0_20_42_13]
MRKYKISVTLIELMIAVVLLSVILLVGATIDIAARKFYNLTDRQAGLQNEINPVILRIKRDVNRASGRVGDQGITVQSGNSRFRVRVDNNNTPSDTSDDQWVSYGLVGNEVLFLGPHSPPAWPTAATAEVIADRVTAFVPTAIVSALAAVNRGVDINITACFNPAAAAPSPLCGSRENPNLSVTTRAYSLSLSAN